MPRPPSRSQLVFVLNVMRVRKAATTAARRQSRFLSVAKPHTREALPLAGERAITTWENTASSILPRLGKPFQSRGAGYLGLNSYPVWRDRGDHIGNSQPGIQPCPSVILSRLRGRYRWHFPLRGHNLARPFSAGRWACTQATHRLPPTEVFTRSWPSGTARLPRWSKHQHRRPGLRLRDPGYSWWVAR
jgi:hypothetical protein